jgi:hypothetical protein
MWKHFLKMLQEANKNLIIKMLVQKILQHFIKC